MARLHEYQGKKLLAANGFRIPHGRAASSAEDAVEAAGELGGEVVIKIQAWTTGRAGIGGVGLCEKTGGSARPHGADAGNESGPVPGRNGAGGGKDRDRTRILSFLCDR